MSIQTTIPFAIRKKSFYGNNDSTPKLDFSNASLQSTPSARYTPTVRKIVDISSESESDSDLENVIDNKNIQKTPTSRKGRRKDKDEGK